jgi:hypothetical protein
MKATCYCETSVEFQRTITRYIPENRNVPEEGMLPTDEDVQMQRAPDPKKANSSFERP